MRLLRLLVACVIAIASTEAVLTSFRSFSSGAMAYVKAMKASNRPTKMAAPGSGTNLSNNAATTATISPPTMARRRKLCTPSRRSFSREEKSGSIRAR